MRLALPAILSLLLSVQAGPPSEPGPFRPADLVELVTLDSTIKLDVRYATPNNLAGRAVYAEARAFLQRPAAEALVRAHRALKASGFGLLVFDGYRPWRVTKLFWDVTPPEKRQFVADQHEAVLQAMGEYHPQALVVLDVDFGHTDPQFIVPYGGTIRLDAAARRIHVHY